jgi:hypothetical protein
MVISKEGQPLRQAEGVRPPVGSDTTTILLGKLMEMGIPLQQYVNGKMFYGVKTGLNEAFVIDKATRERLIAEDPRSDEVVKPFLRGRDIGRYAVNGSELFLLYIGWRCRIADYPAVQAHLEGYHDRLLARPESAQGRVPWYALSRYAADYYSEFDGSKIVYPDIAPRAEFSWDESGAYVGNTTYFIPTNKKYLCALLNSSLIGYVFASLSPKIRGGSLRFFSQYMEQLPIIEPTPADQERLAALVEQLQALGGQGPQVAALEREVDEIVYRTYGLTDEEIAEIERWHAERRAQLGAGRRGQAQAGDASEEEE